jgi:hypothetical protein
MNVKEIPMGSSTCRVKESARHPKSEKSACRFSAKKLKYLKNASIDRLNVRLTSRAVFRRRCDSWLAM